MSKDRGFIFFETIIATIIIISFVFIFVPTITTIEKEKRVLLDRRTIANLLYDELQNNLINKSIDKEIGYRVKQNALEMNYTFSIEQGLIKGCVLWENIKNKYEEICFYGPQE